MLLSELGKLWAVLGDARKERVVDAGTRAGVGQGRGLGPRMETGVGVGVGEAVDGGEGAAVLLAGRVGGVGLREREGAWGLGLGGDAKDLEVEVLVGRERAVERGTVARAMTAVGGGRGAVQGRARHGGLQVGRGGRRGRAALGHGGGRAGCPAPCGFRRLLGCTAERQRCRGPRLRRRRPV